MENIVSIIVPVYNVEKYIYKCIKSIIDQTYKKIEILIINDGSTDNSIALIQPLIDQRCTILNKKNGGLSSARNCGLKHAHGEYIFFLDADDWIESTTIECLISYMKNNDIDIVQGTARYCFSKFSFEDRLNNEKLQGDIVLEYFKQKKYKTYVWNKMYTKEILQGLEFREGFLHEDIIFSYEIAKKNPKILNISEVIYNYFQQEESIMHQLNLEKKIKCLDALNVVIDDCKKTNYKYINLSCFNKYISCVYLICDCYNGNLNYKKELLLKLKDEANKSKKEINIKSIKTYVTKKNYYIYVCSLLSYKLTALFFRMCRRTDNK